MQETVISLLLCSSKNRTPRLQSGRITISISDRDHLALKLLSLQQHKKVLAIVQEAICKHLEKEGAYNLAIHSIPDATE